MNILLWGMPGYLPLYLEESRTHCRSILKLRIVEKDGRQTEEAEAKESGTQESGQSATSQENADVQGSHSAESTASENTGVPVVYMTR